MQFRKCFLGLENHVHQFLISVLLFQIPGNQPLQWECPGQAPGLRPAHDEAGLLRLPAPPRGAASAPLRAAARAGGDPRPAPRSLRRPAAPLRPQRPGCLWQTGQWSSVISMFISTAFFNRKRPIWMIVKQGLSLLMCSYFHDLFSGLLHSGRYLLILCWLRSITVQFYVILGFVILNISHVITTNNLLKQLESNFRFSSLLYYWVFSLLWFWERKLQRVLTFVLFDIFIAIKIVCTHSSNPQIPKPPKWIGQRDLR